MDSNSITPCPYIILRCTLFSEKFKILHTIRDRNDNEAAELVEMLPKHYPNTAQKGFPSAETKKFYALLSYSSIHI